MLDKLFNSTKILEKSLNATWVRNEAISQNLANVETPGYKRKDVPFEQRLKEAMDNATPGGSEKSYTNVSQVNVDDIDINVENDSSALSMRLDGNNVDVDSESAQLAKNSIKYNVLTDALNSQYKRLRAVITEGRR